MQKYFENELMTTAFSDKRAAVSDRHGVIEPVINLVGNKTDAFVIRDTDQGRKRVGRHHGAGRIGRACDQHAGQRLLRCAARNVSPVMAKRFAASVSISTGSQPSAVRMWRYGGYPGLAMATRSPGSNIARNARMNPADDPVVTITRSALDRHTVGFRIMPRDARPQRGNAERLGVAERALAEHGLHRRDGGRRRAHRRLADLHVNDLAARGLDPGRRRHHVHHHERRHVAAG